jgi:hypothetical protein
MRKKDLRVFLNHGFLFLLLLLVQGKCRPHEETKEGNETDYAFAQAIGGGRSVWGRSSRQPVDQVKDPFLPSLEIVSERSGQLCMRPDLF